MGKKIYISILFIALSSFSNPVFNQEVPDELNEIFSKTLDSMHTVLKSKSLSVAIQLDDGSIWKKAIGISSSNPIENVTPDHLYLIGSVTKTITAASIVKLADENKLQLDDKLGKYIEPITHIDSNITIRQLLRHQSGIYDVLENQLLTNEMLQKQNELFYPEYFIKKYIKPSIFTPGSKWSYSNTNFFLLGMIIEKVTGTPFYETIREQFYTPLNLSSFAIPSFENMGDTIAHVWLDINGDGVNDDAHSFYINYFALNSVAGAAGGYYSTASDLARWMKSYMRGDLISESNMNEIKETVFASGVPQGTYGLGIMKKKFGGVEAFGHGGDLAYSASSWYFPSLDLSIAVLNNDAKYNSWTLVPVINELIKKYQIWNTTVSNNDIREEINVKIYPNPFCDKITIEGKDYFDLENTEWRIMDVNGKFICNTSIKKLDKLKLEIDLYPLPNGSYYLQFIEGTKTLYSKTIIKNN